MASLIPTSGIKSISGTLSTFEFFQKFPNEEAVRQLFEKRRRNEEPVCGHCGSLFVTECKDQKPMAYRRKDFRRHFSVNTGTVLAESHLPLRKWLRAIYMLTSSRKGKYVNASKTLMIENTAVLFASGESKLPHDLALKDDLENDLGTFTIETTAAGNSIISAQQRSSGRHGDLRIALVLGAFAAQYLKPQLTAQGKLKGWL